MRIADTIQDSIVDGPGLRFVVFTQGCPHHCPGCHNPGTHDPAGGKEVTVDALEAMLASNPLTDGLTLTGGEPFLQAEACADLARRTHARGLNVWCYTGYTYEQLCTLAQQQPEVQALLDEIDVLIDGPFLLEQRSLTLKWRGSRNQRVIDMAASRAAGQVVEHENR